MRGVIFALAVSLLATSPAPGQPGGPSSRALPLAPGSDLGFLAEQLFSESSRFVETVRYELGGNRQGRNLEIRGNALIGASESYQRELLAGNSSASRRLRALENVERSLAEVQSELNNPAGTAPLSASTARSVARLAGEIRRNEGGYDPQPPFPPPPPPTNDPAGYDSGKVGRFADATRVNAGALATQIEREIGYLYPYDEVVRDLRRLADDLSGLGQLAKRRAPLSQVQASFRPIRGQARRIGGTLDRARPPAHLANLWSGIDANLAQIEELILGTGPITPPIQPPISPPIGTLPPTARIVALIDQALGEIDAYAAAIRPNVGSIPEGPQFQSDARGVRDALVAFRPLLVDGIWDASARRAFSRVDTDSRRLADRTVRVSQGRIGPNNARAMRVRELVEQMGELLPR